MPTLFHIQTADHLSLQGYAWPAALGATAATASNTSKAILITHGLGEHALRYSALAEFLNGLGVSVYAYDLRGHGASPGARGRLASGDELADNGFVGDLCRAFDTMQAHFGAAPLVLGHSLGGLITLRFVLAKLRAVPAAVISSPALAIYANPIERVMIKILPKLLPNLGLPNGLITEKISHDAACVAAYRADAKVHGVVSPRLVGWMISAMQSCAALAPTLATPSLLLYAGDDALVKPSGSSVFAAAAPQNVLSSYEIAGAYHEIFNEAAPWRAQALDRLSAWLANQNN